MAICYISSSPLESARSYMPFIKNKSQTIKTKSRDFGFYAVYFVEIYFKCNIKLLTAADAINMMKIKQQSNMLRRAMCKNIEIETFSVVV